MARLDQAKFYKMADCRRPEVDRDLIFGQKVGSVNVVLETKFGDPSWNRLGAIQIILLRRRRRRRRRGVCHYAQTNSVGSGVKIYEKLNHDNDTGGCEVEMLWMDVADELDGVQGVQTWYAAGCDATS